MGGQIMVLIGAEARYRVRGVSFGVLVALLALGNVPAVAAPYSDIVIDANTGNVLHATNPDASRHPASLTKIMTLYLLFEQLEAGKLKLDTPLKVSEHAADQSPTKLGLKPGSTIQVEDAIKGMVTRSANDAAVVVAEAISGDEAEFAKLMTRKAHALGMTRTVYRNASGLPEDDQVTSARDQSILGRAIQERFPRHYKYFSTRSFNFRGQRIGNHNNLLGRVEGVDGIKTGYIHASGFNLVTSVRRGNRYLVAVVLGGSSAGSRDARMRELISDKIKAAATKRTAPVIAEAAQGGESRTVAVVTAEPQRAAKGEEPTSENAGKAEAKPAPQIALASAVSRPVPATSSGIDTGENASAENAHTVTTIGSTDPIKPVLVKTLAVRAGRAHAPTPASLSPVHMAFQEEESAAEALPPPPAETKPENVPIRESAQVAVTETPKPAESVTVTPAVAPAAASAPPPKPAPVRAAKIDKPTEKPAAKPQARSGWVIQVGAFQAEEEAKQRLSKVRSKASKMLDGADPFTETIDKGGTTYYRARFAGLDKEKAEAACKYLKRNDVECVTTKY
jgi:D-alanyl-D-alanine carboxypeptidase